MIQHKKIHRMLALLLCAVMCLAIPMSSSAAVVENDNSIAQPCYEYTINADCKLTISNGVATCYATCTGYSTVTTKVSIKVILQKKGWLTYSDVETWSTTINTYTLTSQKNKSVTSGTYRLKVIYMVYSGDNFETITDYSNSATC